MINPCQPASFAVTDEAKNIKSYKKSTHDHLKVYFIVLRLQSYVENGLGLIFCQGLECQRMVTLFLGPFTIWPLPGLIRSV